MNGLRQQNKAVMALPRVTLCGKNRDALVVLVEAFFQHIEQQSSLADYHPAIKTLLTALGHYHPQLLPRSADLEIQLDSLLNGTDDKHDLLQRCGHTLAQLAVDTMIQEPLNYGNLLLAGHTAAALRTHPGHLAAPCTFQALADRVLCTNIAIQRYQKTDQIPDCEYYPTRAKSPIAGVLMLRQTHQHYYVVKIATNKR